MRPRGPLAIAFAAVLAALLVGCAPAGTAGTNAKKFSGPAKDVAQTVDDLATAGGKRDAKTICTQLLAPALVTRLDSGRMTCQDVITDQLKDSDVSTLNTQSVKVMGDHATAVVRSQFGGTDRDQTLSFVRVSGAWRVSGLAPAGG